MAKVDFILAGYERGGTTLLSDVFRSNGFESGFECGVLMVETPAEMSDLKPYWDNLLASWSISEDVRAEAANGGIDHFYDALCAATFPGFEGRFFDKTPIYMSQLGLCLHRAKNVKGAVIIHRDPRAVFCSWAKRLKQSPGKSIESFIDANVERLATRYLNYFVGCAAHLDAENVLFVPFEELVTSEEKWLERIGLFVNGRPFVKRQNESRFHNVHSKSMDAKKLTEYERLIGKDLQWRILDATQLASVFFAEDSHQINPLRRLRRLRYKRHWHKVNALIESRMAEFDLPRMLVLDSGIYFEPFTYLLRYQDVLDAGLNPVTHFMNLGSKEGRRPS